jgi:hypothetical protein
VPDGVKMGHGKDAASIKDFIGSSLDLLSNDKVRGTVVKDLGGAFDELKDGHPLGFVKNLADLGQTVANASHPLAKTFLDSLGKLPGPVGRFFQDKKLNAEIVDSGALGEFFGATEQLAKGDMGGAMKDMGAAIGKLLTHEPRDIHIPGTDVGVNSGGVEAMAKLFGRFVDALPDKVKHYVEEKAAKLMASTGLKSVPIVGDAYAFADDGAALVSAIQGGDGLDIGIAAGQLALDGAGLFEVSKPLVEPMKVALGTVKIVKGAAEVVETGKTFGRDFVSLN